VWKIEKRNKQNSVGMEGGKKSSQSPRYCLSTIVVLGEKGGIRVAKRILKVNIDLIGKRQGLIK